MMMTAYAAARIVAALAPRIFADLGCRVSIATPMACFFDGALLIAFITLQRWPAWHNRAAPLVLGLLLMPAGFFMYVLGGNLPVVLFGEVLLGLVAGLAYYAALYYAMVVKNASVDAGGTHEALIGTAFAIGPLIGLAAGTLTGVWDSAALGHLASSGVLFALCTAAVGWTLGRRGRR